MGAGFLINFELLVDFIYNLFLLDRKTELQTDREIDNTRLFSIIVLTEIFISQILSKSTVMSLAHVR